MTALTNTIWHEWRTRLSRPAVVAALVFFVLMLIYGAVSGRSERNAQLDAAANHQVEVSAAMVKWLGDLQALETQGAASGVPPWSGSAMDVTFASSLPVAPLSDFAIGQSDLLPHLGALSLWDPDIRLFSRYEIEDPVALSLGAFDIGKAVLLVLPLLLIVLCFDVLSSDTDSNRLSLLLAQGARVRSLVWSRLLIRAGIVLLLLVVVAAVALILPGREISVVRRLPAFALWLACALLYAAFWIALLAYIASRNGAGEVNVMLALLAWCGFTLILPACASAIAEVIYPAPSRIEHLAEARDIEIETELVETDISKRFVTDHPDMVIDSASEMPGYVRTAFFVTSAVDAATRPVLARFEDAAAKRDEVLSALRYTSPAIIVHGAFNDLAGTSSARHRSYMRQARAHKAAYAEQVAEYVVAGRRLPVDVAASLRPFRFEEESASAVLDRNRRALIFLGLVTILLSIVADRRLRATKDMGRITHVMATAAQR
jgi:ABC-2 type transport system permease protein